MTVPSTIIKIVQGVILLPSLIQAYIHTHPYMRYSISKELQSRWASRFHSLPPFVLYSLRHHHICLMPLDLFQADKAPEREEEIALFLLLIPKLEIPIFGMEQVQRAF